MKQYISPAIAVLLAVLLTAGCSTQKNTGMTRFYHSTTAHFNAYYNGKQAYIDGCELQEKAVQDNYLEPIALLPVSNEAARKSGTASFDRAIEKSKKCVTLHSIKAKPVFKPGHKKTDKDKKELAKNEYNPFLWHAWMLMADAQMQKGEFLEAASTYSYICRLYSGEHDIVTEANIRMAECYSELGWKYEADDVLDRLEKDSIPARLKGEYAAVKASYLLSQSRYPEAIQPLKKSISGQKNSKLQKIRRYYLLGQLYKETGDMKSAYDCFQKVIRMNPPYQIGFNARIQQTETMTGESRHKIEKKLQRMTRNPNNRDYLDQIYYAIGNIYLAEKDTVTALDRYETGLKESEARRPERGILLLRMAEIYWERRDYSNAQRCYSDAVGLIAKDHPSYDEVKLRSSVLEHLVGYNDDIVLQDSLQYLTTLPEDKLFEIIDRNIQILIEREEEEARLAEKAEREAENAAAESAAKSISTNDGSWYFYNPALRKDGAAKFTSLWGRRKLEDNWRRSNKTASISDDTSGNADDATGQSTEEGDAGAAADSTAQSDDPHTRAFYMQQIPFTAEQLDESNRILSEALFNAGVIYKDELIEYELAEGSLSRSANDYSEYDYADDALYNLYLLYSLWSRPEQAAKSKTDLMERYPDSEFSKMLSDPHFEENIIYGKHREDSLYQVAYSHYLAGNTVALEQCCKESAERFPNGILRSKFMFLEASNRLKANDIPAYLDILKQIVEQYPADEISSLAEIISQEIRSGKSLQSNSLGSIWDISARNRNAETDNSGARPEFNSERQQPYIVLLAYPAGSINENELMFETASYNFSRYMVRNFDIGTRSEEGIDMLTVGEFLNFDEAWLYRKRLFEEREALQKLSDLQILIITPANLEILLQHYSFNEYIEFFNSNFLDIPEFDIDGLTLDEELVSDNG